MTKEDIVDAIKDIIATIAPDEELDGLKYEERLRDHRDGTAQALWRAGSGRGLQRAGFAAELLRVLAHALGGQGTKDLRLSLNCPDVVAMRRLAEASRPGADRPL
jgi:hypothetical protein